MFADTEEETWAVLETVVVFKWVLGMVAPVDGLALLKGSVLALLEGTVLLVTADVTLEERVVCALLGAEGVDVVDTLLLNIAPIVAGRVVRFG